MRKRTNAANLHVGTGQGTECLLCAGAGGLGPHTTGSPNLDVQCVDVQGLDKRGERERIASEHTVCENAQSLRPDANGV